MPNILRGKLYLGIFILIWFSTSVFELQAQVCAGFPAILELGSQKTPDKLCSPVTATLNYNIRFASPVPPGTLEIEYNWNDGDVETFNLVTGITTYTHSRAHPFPEDSDCEFNVVITLIYNGVRCASTRQVQKVASWRTDEFNGGNVQLISPVTGTNVHEVCEGIDIDVIFPDETNFNCNPNYVHAPGPLPVESPNVERRWQQIVYNTNDPAVISKIPNITVDGVAITNATGGDLPGRADYMDPRGVFYMASPVLPTTAKRPTLRIEAPGGFGPGYPQVGDEFQITLRYWNFCNPYSNDLMNPNVPVSGDFINGDNDPVERTAYIRIVNSPNAPDPSTDTRCYGQSPNHFTVTNVPAGYRVNWYRNNAGAPGTQITGSNTSSSSLDRNKTGTGYTNNTTPGTYIVWASVQPNVAGGMNCESPKVMVTRTVRSQVTVPNPTIAPPTEVCNGDAFSITMPAPASLPFGGSTEYTWAGSTGVTISGTPSATLATFNTNVTFGAGQTYVDRTITVRRRFTTSPNCEATRDFTVRIYRPSVGGTPSSVADVCETSPVGTIALSGHIGEIVRWEVKKDAGAFVTYTGPSSGNSITPGVLPSGVYLFRAVVRNGPCSSVNSDEEQITISANPGLAANAGTNQYLCGPLISDPIGASNPAPGIGTWSYIASLSTPTSLPTPTISDINDPNATIQITAANAGTYVMRWRVANGTCTSFDDVIIDFGANPTDPIAGNDKPVCGTTTTLEGNTLSIGLGEWIVMSGPGGCSAGAGNCPQLNIINPTSPVSDIELTGTPQYGTYTLRWTATSGGAACFYEEDEVLITFDEPVLITSAPDVDGGCIDPNNLVPIALSGTMGGGGVSGHWEVVSGDGTVTGTPDLSNPLTDGYTPTINDYNAGTPIVVKFVVSPAGTSSCPAVEEEVEITIDRKPVADAGSDIGNICSDQIQLNAEIPIPFGATGVWSSPDPGLTFHSSADGTTLDNTDPEAFVKGLSLGANTVTWTLTSASGVCVSDPSTITLTRVVLPASTAYDVYECELSPAGGLVETSITLTNYEDDVTTLAAGDRQITWYRHGPPPGGTLVTTPSALEFNVFDNQLYVARIRDLLTNCTSDANVTIHVRPLPTALDGSAALCEDTPGGGIVTGIDLTDNFYIDKVTGGAAGLEVKWYNTLLDAQTNSFEITAPFDIVGNRKVYASVAYSAPSITAPACPDFAELDLLINSIPTSTGISGDPTVCMGQPIGATEDPDDYIAALPIYTYQITSFPGAKYHWNVPQGAGEFVLFAGGGINDFFVILKYPHNAAPVDLDISVVIELNSCSSISIPLTIQRTATPLPPTINGLAEVCENRSGAVYDVPGSNPSSDYVWTITRQSDDTEGGAFIVAGQGSDEIFVNYTDEPINITVREQNENCSGPPQTLPVGVNLLPRMQDNDPLVCSDAPIGITFQPATANPVINHYNILSFSSSASINFVTPAAGPVAANNVTDTHILNHAFENLTAVPRTVNYSVEPVSVSGTGVVCAGPSQILTVTIQPEPQLNSGLNKNICSEESTSIRLISEANTFPADKFIVTAIGSMGDPAVLPAGVAPVDPNHMLIADGVTLHDDNIIMDHAFTNTSGSNAVVSYTIVPYSTLIGCPGNPPSPVLLTIHPQTTVNNPPVSNSPLCNGDLVNIAFSSTDNPDANFLWSIKSYDPQIILGSPAAGIGNVSNMIVSNSDLTTSGFIRFGVKGKNIVSEETTAGCENPEILFDIEVKPSPEANNLLDLDACSDMPGGNAYTTDLQTLEASVTPDHLDPNTQIDWYQNYPATPITAPNVNAYLMQGGVPVFVEVSSTITGCSKVVQVSYDVHPNVSLQVQNEVDITCFGDNNGEVRVGVLTGTPPQYSFQIKRDTDVSFGPKINVTAALHTFNSLKGGDYNIRVEDSEGCFAVINADVIEPDKLQVSVPVPPLKEISCFGGSDGEIQAIAIGGVGPYDYEITQINESNTTGIFTNLSSGSYVVQVADANLCPANATVFLAQPTQVVINSMVAEINAYGGNLSCNNAVDGRIDFDATGGNAGNYSYELFRNNGALPYKAITNTPNTTDFFDQLEHGNYLLIAYDAKSCPSSPKFAAISNPQPFDPGVIGSNMSVCSGFAPDQIRQLAPAFGGLGNYQYSWEQSANGTNWFPVLGADQPTYNPPVLTHDATIPVIYYRRIVTTGGCAPGINNPVEVTVHPTPVASVFAPSNVCKGAEGNEVTLSLSPGDYPVKFSYTIKDYGTFMNIIRGDPATILLPALPNDLEVSFHDITDFNGCQALDPPIETINVFEVQSDFNLSDDDICSGEQITVDWPIENDIVYKLDFGDGQEFNTNTGLETKTFINNSTQNPNTYSVRLIAAAPFIGDGSCFTTTTKQFTVGPTTLINLLPGPDDLCSGEFFTVEDKSEGVTASRWYRQMDPADPGTRQEVAQGPLDPFTIQVENTTPNNPQTIKFIYEAENGNCMGATREFEVDVYPYSVANFTVDNDEPVFTGGEAVVHFTNQSNPLETDPGVIEYIWEFDEDEAIISPVGFDRNVRYQTKANKTVTLTAVNVIRPACSSTFSRDINIQLPDLLAKFNVTPRASCLPITIEADNDSDGADIFEWQLIGPDFTLTSNAKDPKWNIATPGTYTVRLTASVSGNPGVSEATPITIQVFDNPIANFELFQARIYKGTEFPVINRSINASEFSWNFGDHPESQNSTSPSPTYRYESEGEYLITLTAFNDHGPFDQDGDGVEDGNVICSDVLTKNIFVQPGGSLKIPNAFTPNVSNPDGSNPGDGTNDIFLPVMDGVEEFTMHIFDRWGNLIFESQDKTKGWNGYDRNGRLMPAGVYVYKVVLRLGDDTRTTKIGDVTLIR